jgi:hypothetical protein
MLTAMYGPQDVPVRSKPGTNLHVKSFPSRSRVKSFRAPRAVNPAAGRDIPRSAHPAPLRRQFKGTFPVQDCVGRRPSTMSHSRGGSQFQRRRSQDNLADRLELKKQSEQELTTPCLIGSLRSHLSRRQRAALL